LNRLSKYDCFLIFQLDSIALQEGQFELPEVLQPPDSNYFSEVCFVFLVNETTLQQHIADGKKKFTLEKMVA